MQQKWRVNCSTVGGQWFIKILWMIVSLCQSAFPIACGLSHMLSPIFATIFPFQPPFVKDIQCPPG